MSDLGWTIAQVARALDVSEKTVRRRVERGTLPAHRVARGRGYEWRIDPRALGLADQPAAAPGSPAGDSSPPPADGAVQSLVELLREKDRQMLDLAHDLGAARERIRLLEEELRGSVADSMGERRSWVRRLLG